MIVGLRLDTVTDLHADVTSTIEKGICSMLIVPLFQDDRPVGVDCATRFEDKPTLGSAEWRRCLCGEVTGPIAYHDQVKKQVQWASHMSLYAAVLPNLMTMSVNEYRLILSLATEYKHMQFWIPVQINHWGLWSDMYHEANLMANIRPLVVVSPTQQVSPTEILRWTGEALIGIWFQGPSLPQPNEINTLLLASGLCITSDKASLTHLHHLTKDLIETNVQYDYLTAPLQPLGEDLDTVVYEVFERDTIKYSAYKAAIAKALFSIELKETGEGKLERRVDILCIGAGRGPLIDAALAAAAMAEIDVHVYAVEKNLNAVYFLEEVKSRIWGDRVTIVNQDARRWAPASFQADILLSELLGSFACNEAAPEILYAVQDLLKPTVRCIPQSYTSYVAPLASASLWNKARSSERGCEQPYIVLFQQAWEITKPVAAFEFHHPKEMPSLNCSIELKFNASTRDSIVHGFSGYFSTNLFDGIEISTNPIDSTPHMISWYPSFFPIRTPLRWEHRSPLYIRIWRISDASKLWYEWSISTDTETSGIHNCNGEVYAIRL